MTVRWGASVRLAIGTRATGRSCEARRVDRGADACSGTLPRRRGFILLEVMVALTLLALVLTPLAVMVFKITSHSHRIVGSSYRNAVLLEEVNYLEALPYDSLSVGTTTTTVTVQPYPHTRTIVVAEVWKRDRARLKTVRLAIAPANALYRRDTASFLRSDLKPSTLFTEDDQ